MSRQQNAAVLLGLALATSVAAQRVAGKQAQILGISAVGLAILSWVVSAAMS